jgi:hypothetical protein
VEIQWWVVLVIAGCDVSFGVQVPTSTADKAGTKRLWGPARAWHHRCCHHNRRSARETQDLNGSLVTVDRAGPPAAGWWLAPLKKQQSDPDALVTSLLRRSDQAPSWQPD